MISSCNRRFVKPLELIHIDLLGPMKTISIGGRSYALRISNYFIPYSLLSFLSKKSKVHESLWEYIAIFEETAGSKVQFIRLDEPGGLKIEIVSVLKFLKGISLEILLPYDSQNIGRAERLVQELSFHALLLLTNTGLMDDLWAEAVHHEDWLRNLLQSNSIQNFIPKQGWRPNMHIIVFTSLPTCGQREYALVY